MNFTFSAYVTLSLFTSIFVLIFAYYWNVFRKFKGFPVYSVLPCLLHYQMTRKKDFNFTSFLTDMLGDMYQKHRMEGLCMAYSLKPLLFVFGEEPIKILLNDKAAINKPMEYKVLADAIGYGLVTSNGERWKQHRKLMNPVFQLGKLKEKVPLFNDHALALVKDLKALEGQPSSDHLYVIKRHYFNALSESIFSLRLCEDNKAEYFKYFEAIDKNSAVGMYRGFQPWLWPMFALKLLPSGKEYMKMYEAIHSFAKNVILEMKKYIALEKESDDAEYFTKSLHKSLTYILLQHHLKDPSFTFEDLHGHVNTFVGAGYDTVSFSTMWCLFTLGLHPEVQERAFQEVYSACENFITYEEMNSFTYLEATIMETLRLYPTIPFYARSISEDVQCGKYKIPKGTVVGFCVYYWHRNPDNFPDPEKFDPERFLNGEKIKSWQHIPFAEGNRACIGKKYAIIEMKIFLAHILRNFKITSLDKMEDVKLCTNIVLAPAKPLRFLITPRARD